jgi:hypothetical protein
VCKTTRGWLVREQLNNVKQTVSERDGCRRKMTPYMYICTQKYYNGERGRVVMNVNKHTNEKKTQMNKRIYIYTRWRMGVVVVVWGVGDICSIRHHQYTIQTPVQHRVRKINVF